AVPLIVKHTPPDRLTPPSGKPQNGAIIDIQDDAFTAAEGHVLTVNLGARNGIAPGNMLTVYRIMYPSVPTARYVVGEVAIVAVRDKTATARVTYSNDAIMPGARVERQKPGRPAVITGAWIRSSPLRVCAGIRTRAR